MDRNARRRVLPLATLVAVLGLTVRAEPPSSDGVAPSTREMAALLARLASEVDPEKLWFNVNTERVELFARQLDQPRSPVEAFRFRFRYASELTYAGRYAEALDTIERLFVDADAVGAELGAEAFINLLMLQATTWLRMGEEQNCAEGHNRDSCLLPIRGRGVHQRREGSERAVGTLERILRIDPANLRARWLINIAHMTLGTYPDGVPPAALIPPGKFASEHPIKPFTNVAAEVGLDIYGLGRRRARGFRQRRSARPHGLGDRLQGSGAALRQ